MFITSFRQVLKKITTCNEKHNHWQLMADWHGVNFKSKGHIEFNQGSTLPYVLELHRIEGLSKLKVRSLQIQLNAINYLIINPLNLMSVKIVTIIMNNQIYISC